MLDLFSLRPETHYGCPSADQILINRHYVVGYSYYFRQAKWALEIVTPGDRDMNDVERQDDFIVDYRIPKRFRATLDDFRGSGYDRGHLVASANKLETQIQNNETFLLSNMAPQHPRLNRSMWRELETAVRELDAKKDRNGDRKNLETYVISGPIFDFTTGTRFIGQRDDNGIEIPIPSHFFKCVLTIDKNNKIHMWAFEMPNEELDGNLLDYLRPTSYIEQRAGIVFWDNLLGDEVEAKKASKGGMW
ncbi:DNA/RNA non-specific endonuclease [Porticoccus sp. W117]|uniref:DNA/RNA non-specific endonuclease n=1 Tax=Porticoccus sp. W117 TaxID=3054777 RepID=UPI002594BF21|nr:DNA/RNA non-specific endonuclease [Porticoccus sp. W117]MDM3871839.1 DNA/RNA non-specific endonuclease [Porticoccus sp. W117]